VLIIYIESPHSTSFDVRECEPAKGKVNIAGSETYQQMTRSWQVVLVDLSQSRYETVHP